MVDAYSDFRTTPGLSRSGGAYLRLMARRPTKLEFHEHPVTCPYCRKDMTVISLMEVLLATRRTCPTCKREILISNGKAVKPSVEHTNKPPKPTSRSRISKAKA